MRILTAFLFLCYLISGCSEAPQSRSVSLPEEAKNLDNLTTYSPSTNTDTVLLRKVNSYGDREGLFFRSMGDFTVDGQGRIYIADAARGSKIIHVFNSAGEHLTSFGGEGRGPREFVDLCCLKIANKKLFVYDSQQSKMNVYSIDPLEYSESIILDATEFNIPDKTKFFSQGYYFLTDSTYLIGFSENPGLDDKGEQRFTDYYIANENWKIISEKVFEHLEIKEVWGEFKGVKIFKRFPFFKKSLMAVSGQGYIYRARADDFLVKKYNQQGEYIGAFYYPYQKQEVSREDALISANKMQRNIAEEVDLPQYWPVLNSMQFDDKDRLWITTVTGSKEKLKWWILDRDGKLIATFMWPGKRAEQAYGLKEDVVVRDGYFYTRQENPETEAEEIVKYEIEISDYFR